MNKLKTAKGSLKDHHRFLADEIDDYAEQPDDYDPTSNLLNLEITSQKTTTHKRFVKLTFRCPKFKPDFNLEVASRGIFEADFGEKLAKYLTISDVVQLLRTCSYLNKVFFNKSIWLDYIRENFGNLTLSSAILSKVNLMQYAKYLRCAKHEDKIFYKKSEKIKVRNDGIMFDTPVIERDIKKEDSYLMRNMVDFVTVKSQKTINTIDKLAVRSASFTTDLKISWVKEVNQICVWVTGYHVQNESLKIFARVLLIKKYREEKSQLVKKTYFLNDRYFVVEIEEKNEEDDESVMETFEVFAIESENDWFEKKETALCKLVLRESFDETKESIKIKNIGDFLVFVCENGEKLISVRVFDIDGKSLNKSKDFCTDAGLYDMIASGAATKSSFSAYLLDKKWGIYFLNYSHESGVDLKRIDQPKGENDFQKEEIVRRYHYGTFQMIDEQGQRKTVEYLMVYKENKFYLMRFDTNELVDCNLPENPNNEPKLFNWTICENYLYLLIDNMVQIYLMNFKDCSVILDKKEIIDKINFKERVACWILVNPCLTVLISAGSLKENLTRSTQLLIGSTQKLLMKPDWYDYGIHFDECRLDMIHGKERIKCKFEDERLLIQTNMGSYYRDFNVCERRAEKSKYEWKQKTIFDLDEFSFASIDEESQEKENNKAKKNEGKFMMNQSIFENRNHEKSRNYNQQNWKNVEKKIVTDEKLEKKENRKKGDKYFKNVRQGKHREKISE